MTNEEIESMFKAPSIRERVNIALHVLRGQPVAWRLKIDKDGRINRRVPSEHLLIDSCLFEARTNTPYDNAINLLADAIDDLALSINKECGENDDIIRKVQEARNQIRLMNPTTTDTHEPAGPMRWRDGE